MYTATRVGGFLLEEFDADNEAVKAYLEKVELLLAIAR